GPLHLRRDRRGRDREAAVRPLLHQEHVGGARSVHHLRNHQDSRAAAGTVMHMKARDGAAGAAAAVVPAGPEPGRGAIVNAMTIDVEDYFHVSVFDGLVPRHRWENMESRVCANTDRLLAIF